MLWPGMTCSRFFGRPGPRFLIIGAQKAGTTTLFDIFNAFDNWEGATVKEIGFFSKDCLYEKGSRWYRSHFPGRNSFEATPEYLYYDFVPERIYRFDRDMRCIVLLRNPVERCFSAWNMFRTFNAGNPQAIYDRYTRFANEPERTAVRELLFAQSFPSFRESVEADIARFNSNAAVREPSFVRRGIYCRQLERFFQYFPPERFLCLEQRELQDPGTLCDKLESFLGIPLKGEVPASIASNAGLYENFEEGDFSEIFSLLKKFYMPYNERLFDLIRHRYDWND